MSAQLKTPSGQPRWTGECPHCGNRGYIVGEPGQLGCNACGEPYPYPAAPLTRPLLDALKRESQRP